VRHAGLHTLRELPYDPIADFEPIGMAGSAVLIDTARMQRNLQRMQVRMNELDVAFRPHVKTTKCIEIARAQIAAGARDITVSTLKEAEQFFAASIEDILYAVGMAAPKLRQAAALINQGCDLKIVADSVNSAAAIVAF
jgi:D-serine deaminase-like pyridoxal phosphate-dependent protein